MDIDQIKIRRLDFSLLVIFDELLRHERTTVVAERLGLSQSAISHALARLRDLFDDPLFSRRPDGLTPTRRALELAPEIRALLRQTQALIGGARSFDPTQSNRLFRLGANDLVSALFGPPMLDLMARQGPATRLTTRFLVGAAAFDALRKDDIDLAIGRFYEMPDEFDAEILLHENFSVIARRGHPAIPEVLDLACYLELDHLLVSFSGRLTGLADEVLARQGLKRRVLTSVPMFLTAFAAVAASDLIATVPERLARRFGPVFDLQVLAPPVTLDSFPITSMRHVSTRSDLGLDWLMDAVRTCCSLV